jgi:hypothetical protein
MLRSVVDFQNFAILATDGTIGHVKDFFFDDEAWVVRYLVVDTGDWLSGRSVLISPYSVGAPDWNGRTIPVSITRAQVKGSPDIDTARPVSRQHEIRFLDYYSYPYYWGGMGFWGSGYFPGPLPRDQDYRDTERRRARDDDPHLRSCAAVSKYHIHASDGDIGHAQGFLVDTETWAIRYLIVDTSNWWLGHQVLIAPDWIEHINWATSSVTIDLGRQAIRDSPPYDFRAPFDRIGELGIYNHYGRDGYWNTERQRNVA